MAVTVERDAALAGGEGQAGFGGGADVAAHSRVAEQLGRFAQQIRAGQGDLLAQHLDGGVRGFLRGHVGGVALVDAEAVLAVLSVLGIFNVRGYVAKYNYEAHVAYEKAVDVRYMETLGDEGVEYLYHLTKDENKKTASEAEDALIRVIPDYYKTKSEYVYKIKTLDDLREVGRQNEGFFSFSFPSERACNAIEQFFADK